MPPSQAPQARVRGVIERNPKAVAAPTPNLEPPQVITPQQQQRRQQDLQEQLERLRRKHDSDRP
jgi:hypothetical protein